MAQKVLVLGDSGTGKTTAAENLNPEETFIICTDRKGLPFKGWKKNYKTILKDNGKLDLEKSNYFETHSYEIVITLIKTISEKKPEVKVILIDTITAMMEDEYMSRIKEKGYEKFEDTALHTFNLIAINSEDLRDDLTLIMTAHTEDNDDMDGVRKTSFKVVGGKLIGQNIKPEARFNMVLYSEVVMEDNVPKYYFQTQNNGKNTCRTPKGMFDELRIPNDYKAVLQKITKFYEG